MTNTQVLAGMGAFGVVFSTVQAATLEHHALSEAPWDMHVSYACRLAALSLPPADGR